MLLLALIAAARGSTPCAGFVPPDPPASNIPWCLDRGEPDERLVDRAIRCLSVTTDDAPAVVLAALASLGAPGAQEGLRRAVCVGTREQAALALRQLGPGEVNEALLAAHLVPLGPDPIRAAAARTLGHHSAWDTLLKLPATDPAVAVGLASDPDPRGPGSERLVRHTRSGPPAERVAAARALTEERNPRATEVLLAFAVDPDVRHHTIDLASGLAHADRVRVWSVLLEDPDPEVRRRTAATIGADEDPGLADLRAQAIAPIDPPRAVAALAAGLPRAWCGPAACSDLLLQLADREGAGQAAARLALFRWYRRHGPAPAEVVALASERVGGAVDTAARALGEPSPAPRAVPVALPGPSAPFLRVPAVDAGPVRTAAMARLATDPDVALGLLPWVGLPGDADRVREHLATRKPSSRARRALAALEHADHAVYSAPAGLHRAYLRPLDRAAAIARAEADPTLRQELIAASWGPLAPAEVVRWARADPSGPALVVLADNGHSAPLLDALAVSAPEALKACREVIHLPEAVGDALLDLARRTDHPERVLEVALARPELRDRVFEDLVKGPWPGLSEAARADLLAQTRRPVPPTTLVSLAQIADPARLSGLRAEPGQEATAAAGLQAAARAQGVIGLHAVAISLLPSTAAKWAAIRALIDDPDPAVQAVARDDHRLPPRSAPPEVVAWLAARAEEDSSALQRLAEQDPQRAITVAAATNPPRVHVLFAIGTDPALEAAAALLAPASDPDPRVERLSESVARELSEIGGSVVERHRAEIEAALAPKYTVVTP